MGERMDGWPLTWKREGRAGWREVVLEIGEKKRGDINLTEGMSLTSFSLSRKRHAHAWTFRDASLFFFLPVLLGGKVEPVGVKNSKE